jgi:hypothetical protein
VGFMLVNTIDDTLLFLSWYRVGLGVDGFSTSFTFGTYLKLNEYCKAYF